MMLAFVHSLGGKMGRDKVDVRRINMTNQFKTYRPGRTLCICSLPEVRLA